MKMKVQGVFKKRFKFNLQNRMFYENPSHYADYEKVFMALENQNDCLLNLSSHKWAEIDINAGKAQPACLKLKEAVDFWKTLPKSIQPRRSKAENKISNMLVGNRDDPVVHLKLLLKETVKPLIFCDIPGKSSLVPSLFDGLEVIILQVLVFDFCKRFVLPDVVEKAASVTQVKLDLADPNLNQLYFR